MMHNYELNVIVDGKSMLATIQATDLDQAILVTRVLNPTWIIRSGKQCGS